MEKRFLPRRAAVLVLSLFVTLFMIATDHYMDIKGPSQKYAAVWFRNLDRFIGSGDNIRQRNMIEKGKGFHKLVHLDLKGAPPLFSYLLELLPLFRQLGATGLLVEYEDMFPYEGVLRNVSQPRAYTHKQITTFIRKAKEHGLEVIPLIQTLGHLEFVLEKREFAYIREQIASDCCVCPTRNESLIILHSMIDDILRAHPDARWIHLGGDEVGLLNSCNLCKARNISRTEIYTDHVVGLMEYVRIRSNNRTRSIIWDDMMRDWSNDSLSNINKYGDVMLWNYAPDLRGVFNRDIVRKYAKAFDTVWVASAFKGADGIDADFVPIGPRITNNRIWREIVGELRSQGCHVQGVTLTGWSRYYHHSGYCELMPSGIPSLALCLNEWKEDYNFTFFNKSLHRISNFLGFKGAIKLDLPSKRKPYDLAGEFPGNDVYRLMAKIHEFVSAQREVQSFEHCYTSGMKFPHCKNMVMNFTTAYDTAKSLQKSFFDLKPGAKDVLRIYYTNETSDAWTTEKIINRYFAIRRITDSLTSSYQANLIKAKQEKEQNKSISTANLRQRVTPKTIVNSVSGVGNRYRNPVIEIHVSGQGKMTGH